MLANALAAKGGALGASHLFPWYHSLWKQKLEDFVKHHRYLKHSKKVISHLILLGKNLCVWLVDGTQCGLQKRLCKGTNASQYLRLKYECGSALKD